MSNHEARAVRRRSARLLFLATVTLLLAPATPAVGATVATDGSAAAAAPAAARALRPNIVVVMLDDIPADIMPRLLRRMPHANALFGLRGLRFRHYFVQDPLCCPSRVTFLTGLYAHHHGVRQNFATRFRSRASLATALNDAGYDTSLVGKYLNNADELADKSPPGWDHVAIFGNGLYYDYTLFVDDVARSYGSARRDYSTDVLAREAVTALRKAPSDRPVFLLWAPNAVHNIERQGSVKPPAAAPRHRRSEACSGIGYRLTPAYNERDVRDKPRWLRTIDYTADPFYTRRGYPLGPVCRALLAVDDGLEAILDELSTQGRLRDTLFILTADNGMGWGDHRRRAKSVPWVTPAPLYVSWRSALGGEAGTIRGWAQNIDLAPTLAELAGATLGPFPTGQAGPDGRSLLDVVLSRGAVTPPRRSLLEDHKEPGSSPRTWRALRTTNQHPLGLWHYIEWASGERELYDLAADPWELHSIVDERPDVVETLRAELGSLLEG